MPPEVGKYKPKFNQVETDQKIAVIRDIHPNVGELRKVVQGEQQAHVCLKVVKGLNYPVYHEKSQARRLAKVNKKLLEMEKIAAIDHTQIELDAEEHATKEKDQDEELDLLNFYVKEMREPIY